MALQGGPLECVDAFFVLDGEAVEDWGQEAGETAVGEDELGEVVGLLEVFGYLEEKLVGETEERHGTLWRVLALWDRL